MLGPDDQKALIALFVSYFDGDDADIELPPGDLAANLSRILAAKATNEGNLSFKDAEQLLRANLPAQVMAQDPEAVNYTAKTLATIVRDQTYKARIARAAAAVEKLVPQFLTRFPRLRKDIKDNLWTLNDQTVGISEDQAKNHGITGASGQHQLSVKQTGMPLIYMHIDDQLVSSQLISLVFAVLLVLLLVTAQFKSLVAGFIGVVPIVLTVCLNFGVMSWLGIALDPATVMIAAVAVGIGIDYTIHFMSRFRREVRAGRDIASALDATLRTTGRAIVINATTVLFGFLVLIWGQLVPMKYFGALMALTMVVSALGAITVLPALIQTTGGRFALRK